jgi:hypothetical protein
MDTLCTEGIFGAIFIYKYKYFLSPKYLLDMVFNYGQGQLHHSPLCINVHRAYNEWNQMNPAYFWFECLFVFYIFLLQLADIKRLLPRLKSMSFKLRFNDMVQDIKPVSVLVFP